MCPQIQGKSTLPAAPGDLFRSLDEERWRNVESEVLSALGEYADRANDADSFQRRLFADDAVKGLGFVETSMRRYDAVLMNPPFGLLTADGLEFAKNRYSGASNDIYACFVERGIEWLSPGGRVGVLSSRLGFFLHGLHGWRDCLLSDKSKLVSLADLGYGVLDDAVVETAAYVVEKESAAEELTCFSVLRRRDKAEHRKRSGPSVVR